MFTQGDQAPAGHGAIDLQGGYSHCNFTALPTLSDERVQPWVDQLLAMDWENPEHRTILELEGLRQWVLPKMDGYASLFDAVKEQGISPRW